MQFLTETMQYGVTDAVIIIMLLFFYKVMLVSVFMKEQNMLCLQALIIWANSNFALKMSQDVLL